VVSVHAHDATVRGLVGKELLVLTNLEPKAIRGQESHGMILAAEVQGQAVPAIVPDGQADALVE
jgi:tRNA-binding EMAP/Myf-like protein